MIRAWLSKRARPWRVVAERDRLAARVAELEGDLAEARAELVLARAQRDEYRQAYADANDRPDEKALQDRIDALLEDNARLRHAAATTTTGGLEELLRERETNRRLAGEVHRLTVANIAADRGWR